ncbi:MAG: hypothetical protein JWQ72_3004 [Polaromonas sp.]|nr:hypothetical protein [Polaromonas sp.]
MATEPDPDEQKWSQHVTETSNALDLQEGIFRETDPKKIAQSLKRSAEHSSRRKADPYRSAMSMLTFYINRAGQQLPEAQHQHLEAAKDELRALYGKPPPRRRGRKATASPPAGPDRHGTDAS